jgi:hypothetical protein
MDEGDEDKEFPLAAGGWAGMRAELLREPELVSVLVALPETDRPAVHVMSSSIMVKRPNAEVQILVSGEDEPRSADPAFCRSVVDFLISALDPVNPAFGRVCVGEPVTPKANLDAALKRKLRKSVAEARQSLRGYAWVTVCPAELTDALGGADAEEVRCFPPGLLPRLGRNRAPGDRDTLNLLRRGDAQDVPRPGPRPSPRNPALQSGRSLRAFRPRGRRLPVRGRPSVAAEDVLTLKNLVLDPACTAGKAAALLRSWPTAF